ncbi:trigger factor [Neochlamydia sp. EPS4]|uniref:trigger factor n=1 Tax=Neochlamydia sp. EPS4 TaxID=1478175 RepID=UPI0005D12EB9|nr:trigger factor [Neochlamydia sp. EPS4]
MSDQQNEYKNDNLHVIFSRAPGCKIKLEITVSPLATQAAYKKAIKNVNKEVTLPGFRKGKAPENFVVQNYKAPVHQEWNDLLVNTAFQEALELTQAYPFSRDTIQRPQIKEISLEKGAHLVIEYEAEPRVPKVKPDELTVKKAQKKPISPAQIEEILQQIQLSHATWEDRADHPIIEGDYVNLTIENMDEGFEICKDSRFQVEKGKLGAWLYNLLIGKNVNDVVEGMSEQDSTHAETCEDPTHDHSEHANFKPTRCKITITAHQQALLPEVNDELAAKAGAPTVEELKARIEKNLEKRADEYAQMEQRRQIEKQLAEKYPFDIPYSLTKEDKELQIMQALKELRAANLSPEEFEKKSEEAKQKITQNIENAYRLFYLLREIADDHQIEVSQEEIMQEFMKQMVSQETALIDESMKPEDIRARLHSFLITQKTKDLLAQQAQTID